MKTLVCVVGPTASGKTNLAIALAKRFRAPVLSVDSVQMYRGLDIGSGKATIAEMQGVPHFMVDVLDPDQQVTAAEFSRMADEQLTRLFAESDVVIAAGGSGFYLQALVEGLDDMPEIPESVRAGVRGQFEAEGLANLLKELKEADPVTFEQIDRSNPARVCRAVEVQRASGKPISAFRKGQAKPQKPYEVVMVGLKWERKELNDRIDRRVGEMIARGWLEEVKGLLSKYDESAPALGSLGYRELAGHIQGLTAWDETVHLIKVHTHQFAKRQMTWFNRYPQIHWIEPDDLDGAISWVSAKIRE